MLPEVSIQGVGLRVSGIGKMFGSCELPQNVKCQVFLSTDVLGPPAQSDPQHIDIDP